MDGEMNRWIEVMGTVIVIDSNVLVLVMVLYNLNVEVIAIDLK